MSEFTNQTGTANPFNGIDVGSSSAPSLADIDGDGDLDLVVGELDGKLKYYKNTGSTTQPSYVEQTGAANPFNSFDVGQKATPSFADIDGDGDLDLVVGKSTGTLIYFENTGSTTSPNYVQRTGAANPFNGFDVGYDSAPSFADIGGDGDLDLVVGDRGGLLSYFENTGTTTSPGYVAKTGTANPFNSIDVGGYSAPSLADIDGDGDLDSVVGENLGTLKYFENTGSSTQPSYVEQTGAANPFNGIDVGGYSAPSFADIDGDGDPDAIVGNSTGTLAFLLNVVCFLPGTLIATPTGERPIETLQPGDLITTAEGPQPVKFLSRTRRHRSALLALGKMPVRVAASALGQLGPSRDTYMTPSHAIHLDGHLVEAGALLNGSTIQQLESLGQHEFLTYHNIELEAHALIWANGLQVESYFATIRNNGFTRSEWDNFDEYIALYGSSEPMQELSMPRIPFARQIPLSLRNKFGLRCLPPLTLDLCAAYS